MLRVLHTGEMRWWSWGLGLPDEVNWKLSEQEFLVGPTALARNDKARVENPFAWQFACFNVGPTALARNDKASVENPSAWRFACFKFGLKALARGGKARGWNCYAWQSAYFNISSIGQ